MCYGGSMDNNVKKTTIIAFKSFLFWIPLFAIFYLFLFFISFLYSLQDQQQAFWAVIQIIISLIIPIFFVDYTIRHENKKEYTVALNHLKEEILIINQNLDFHEFYINILVREWNILNGNPDNWLPKIPSYGLSYGMYQRTRNLSWEESHGLPGYLLQYLPSKAYYLFLENGFYNQIKTPRKHLLNIRSIDNSRIWHLMEMYDYCIDFSQKSQEIEQLIHDKIRDDPSKEEDIYLYYGYILFLYNNRCKSKFDEHFNAINYKEFRDLEYSIVDSYRESILMIFKNYIIKE